MGDTTAGDLKTNYLELPAETWTKVTQGVGGFAFEFAVEQPCELRWRKNLTLPPYVEEGTMTMPSPGHYQIWLQYNVIYIDLHLYSNLGTRIIHPIPLVDRPTAPAG